MRFRQQSRDLWSFPAIDGIAQDARYGIRMLRRAPAFTAAAVLSLAIGIGSTAAVFSVADAVLFRRLPIKQPRQLHELRAVLLIPGSTKVLGGVSESLLGDLQHHTDFAELAGYRVVDDVRVAGGGAERPVTAEFVSASYFQAVGVGAQIGRLLTHADSAHAPLPIVLSERLWRTLFDADGDVGRRGVTINGVPAHVVGVADEFRGLVPERPADVFVPLAATGLVDNAAASTSARVVVRLHHDVAVAEAEQRFAALYKRFSPPSLAADALRISLPDASQGVSEARELLARPLFFGLVITGVLLLVACANTSGLMLTRFASRQGEFGVRVAIGAGSGRLARQLLVESLLVAVIAAIVGLLVARVSAPLLVSSIPLGSMPVAFEVRFGWRLVAFTFTMSAIAALVAATAALVRLFRSNTAGILSTHSRSLVRGRRRATAALIAAQVACSLLLMVAAGSMTQTIIKLARIDPGFDPAGAIAVTIDASGLGLDPRTLPAYFSGLHGRLESSPAVSRVSFAQLGLMTRAATTGTVDVAGRPPASDIDRLTRLFWVGPDFFETTGMRLIRGRPIGRVESAGRQRVAVVNEEFARFYFGNQEAALGHVVNRDITIIGIVANARYNSLRDEPVRAMFLPHTQAPPRSTMTFVVRPSGDAKETMSAVAATVRTFDARVKVRMSQVAELVAATVSRERFVATLGIVVSVLAVFLACAGLYAAVTYSVSERRNELAVRLALGAARTDIVRVVLHDPLRITLLGLILGVPATYVMMRGLSALLFDVRPFDVPTVALCSLALLLVAASAVLLPARRALAIDPQECLRPS